MRNPTLSAALVFSFLFSAPILADSERQVVKGSAYAQEGSAASQQESGSGTRLIRGSAHHKREALRKQQLIQQQAEALQQEPPTPSLKKPGQPLSNYSDAENYHAQNPESERPRTPPAGLQPGVSQTQGTNEFGQPVYRTQSRPVFNGSNPGVVGNVPAAAPIPQIDYGFGRGQSSAGQARNPVSQPTINPRPHPEQDSTYQPGRQPSDNPGQSPNHQPHYPGLPANP